MQLLIAEINRGNIPFRKEINKPKEIIKAMIIPTKGARNIKPAVLITGFRVNSIKSAMLQYAAPAKPPIRYVMKKKEYQTTR